MKALIIEDEIHAAKRLESLVKNIEPGIEIVGVIDTVKQAVEWFEVNNHPDLVFMDIQLADGLSFSIFEKCTVHSPIIFTTAYDEYAVKAFKVNSIDYILKPVDRDELAFAYEKFKSRLSDSGKNTDALEKIGEAVRMLTKRYKSRFVVKIGEHLKTIEVNDILYFYSQDKATFCVTRDVRNVVLDFTLEQLEELLDPEQFYRINRKYYVSSGCIEDIIAYTNSRLRLVLKGSQDRDIIVARERVQDFKEWLNR